jgi:serine/threonine-protein kinase HipA
VNHLEVWIDDDAVGGPTLVGWLSKSASRSGDTISFEYAPGWLAGDARGATFALDHEFLWTAVRNRVYSANT